MGDMDVMEGEDVEGGSQGEEECDEGGNEMKFKAKLPKRYRQGPQKRRVRVKVKDYMCFSIISNMFFNILFLGCSLRVRHGKGATEETLKVPKFCKVCSRYQPCGVDPDHHLHRAAVSHLFTKYRSIP
ncbi:hypothetical protein AOLI_G00175400 [Acnodon oligacanthus]